MSVKDDNPIDIKNFVVLVGSLLKEGKVHALDITKDVFGEFFKTFLMKEDMDIIISSSEVSSNCLMFYILKGKHLICFSYILATLFMV